MKGKQSSVLEVQGFSPASSYRETAVHSKQNAVQKGSLMKSVGSPQPRHLLKTRTAGSRNLIKFINTNPAVHWKPPLARMGRKGKDGRLPSHPGPGKGWVLSPGVRSKRGPPRLDREARLIFQTSKSQVVSAPRKRPSVGSACGLRGFFRPAAAGDDTASSRGPGARSRLPRAPSPRARGR